VEIDGIRSVTSTTILPKGGPQPSHEVVYLDFFKVNMDSYSQVNITSTPEDMKIISERDGAQKNYL
jgi:hypothetical protein